MRKRIQGGNLSDMPDIIDDDEDEPIDDDLLCGLSPYFERVLLELGIKTIFQLRARVRETDAMKLCLYIAPGYLARDQSLASVADFVAFCADLGITSGDLAFIFGDAVRVGRIMLEAKSR